MPKPSESVFQAAFATPIKGATIQSFTPPAIREASKAAPQRSSQWLEGFAEGKASAAKELQEKHQKTESVLLAAAAELRKARHNEASSLEPQVVDLALAIAKSVLMKEIEKGNYDIQAIVSEALASLKGDSTKITVRLHPNDHASITQSPFAKELPEIQWAADPKVPKASCSVDTPYGTIVRAVDALLSEIQQAVSADAKGAKA